MSSPTISVILPTYNSASYLAKAIDSVLKQTLTDFELLVMDDGSTDETEKVVLSFVDKRIIYIRNKTNQGLVFTLNKGIKIANGKYIARMDADDICLCERFQKQCNWLDRYRSTEVVACQVAFIDKEGKAAGEWKEDMENVSYRDIKHKMTWESCIAHPTVMMRANIIKQYLYAKKQKHTEDYDLWLRLLADGFIIEKIPEKLLLYRVHNDSITGSILRKSNPFFKLFDCKRKFLWKRVSDGEWNLFEMKVLLTAIHDGIMGVGKEIKKIIRA
jgi:glycosyltransferase involved in cell wall biosynthesis